MKVIKPVIYQDSMLVSSNAEKYTRLGVQLLLIQKIRLFDYLLITTLV